MSQNRNETIKRERVGTIAVDRHLDRIEAYIVTVPPNASTGFHLHSGGTIGYIIEGEASFALEGHAPVTLQCGDGFVEPAGLRIAHFDNVSASEPLTFFCAYPLSGDETLITMLDP